MRTTSVFICIFLLAFAARANADIATRHYHVSAVGWLKNDDPDKSKFHVELVAVVPGNGTNYLGGFIANVSQVQYEVFKFAMENSFIVQVAYELDMTKPEHPPKTSDGIIRVMARKTPW